MFRVFGVERLTSFDSKVKTLGHQLIQQCYVSGTAKGKGKIKAAQGLKKSKTGDKKKASSGPRKMGIIGELEDMADKCMTAPTSLRSLKPKERAREAEREKLGLISKERQREMEQLKKQAKQGSGLEKASLVGTPGLNFISLGLVDADKIPKYELTVEDGRRLAKEYSRVLMRKHRARQKAESTLLRLKEEAIEALPEPLKTAALVPDYTPFPVNHNMASLTPPIEGYMEKIREAADRVSGKAKLR